MRGWRRTGVSAPSNITAHTRVVGVIGHPVRHSLSPVIHNAGFRSTSADYVYVAFDVAPGKADAALEAVRTFDIAGLSVTMPHKSDVARAVDRLVPSAERLDSVNTVEVGEDGALIGHSTDGDGLVSSLEHNDVSVSGQDIVVLGAGGAARSVIDAFIRRGSRSITVVNRTLESARRTEKWDPARVRALEATDDDVRHAVKGSRIVVNATSIGMGLSPRAEISPSDLPVDINWLNPEQIIVDLVYHPIDTPLLRSARAARCKVVDGLGMLVHQAALQQKIWTGLFPDVDEMTRAAVRALR